MLNRRDLLKGILQSTPLLAMTSSVPQFLTRTALAAAGATANKDKILVVVELAGGNDGLNMLVPYVDERYYEARPTIAIAKNEIIRIDDTMGLNPALKPLETLLSDQNVEFIQGVGYPNPIRSHFESMNIWHTADPTQRSQIGWLGHALNEMPLAPAKIPGFNLEGDKAPLAFAGGPAVPTVNPSHSFGLEIGFDDDDPAPAPVPLKAKGKSKRAKASSAKNSSAQKQIHRKDLIRQIAELTPSDPGGMVDFVRQTALDSYSAAAMLKRLVAEFDQAGNGFDNLQGRLDAVARMIQADLGIASISFPWAVSTRIRTSFAQQQDALLGQLAAAINAFYQGLAAGGNADRVLLMTFSEFPAGA